MQLIKPSNRLRQMISPFLKMIFSTLNTYIKPSNRLWQMYQLKNSTENEQLLIDPAWVLWQISFKWKLKPKLSSNVRFTVYLFNSLSKRYFKFLYIICPKHIILRYEIIFFTVTQNHYSHDIFGVSINYFSYFILEVALWLIYIM